MDNAPELSRVPTCIRIDTAEPLRELALPKRNLRPSPPLARPCRVSMSCLRLSLQLAGRSFEQALMLRVGHPYEQATRWPTPRVPK